MSNYNLPNRDTYEKTDRGFVIFDKFKDRYKAEVYIQESSIAFEPCVWVYAHAAEDDAITMIHLTPEGAQRLVSALQVFIEASKLEAEATQ